MEAWTAQPCARVLLAVLLLPAANSLHNGRALTPPMGWTAWNSLVFHPTQSAVEAAMRALARPHGSSSSSGGGGGGKKSLVELGYVQANLDDSWQACGAGVNRSFHDAQGNPLIDLRAFPNMSAMTALGRRLGIQNGWYMNNCNCAENQFTNPAQIARIVRRSAQAVATLGFTSLKLDSCGQFNNLTLWAEELNRTGVAIAIENCHQGGMVPGPRSQNVPGQGSCRGTTEPVSDCPYSSFRSSDDIQPTWAHVVNNVNSLVPFLGDEANGDPAPRSRPGGWAYSDALQTGMLGVLSPSGHTPDMDHWVPLPLVEDRTNFGLHCITSSPLILSFNVSNETLVKRLWDIIANEEAINISQAWAGSPGRLVTTLSPHAAESMDGDDTGDDGSGYEYRILKGQLGQVSGWGSNPRSAHGLTCPTDIEQLPGASPTCNLLRVATATLVDAQSWCTAHADCAAFSYRTTKNSNKNSTTVVAYFKGTTSLFFMDANFHFEGQVQNGWLSQIKHEYATPPGAWRSAPCAGTICPPHSTPCHEACMSIAPCCSDRGPPGEALEYADGAAQLWSKRLANGSLALLFVNLGKASLTHNFTIKAVGMRPAPLGAVSVRDVWGHTTHAPIAHGGLLKFSEVAGHDSRFVVLS